MRNAILFLRSWRAARKCTVTLLSIPWVAKAMVIQVYQEAAGRAADSRGRLKVNEFFQN